MLHVCFAAGLRVSELLTLPLTALTWQPTPTIHIQGKGRRHRVLPLWQQTATDVRAWLQSVAMSRSPSSSSVTKAVP